MSKPIMLSKPIILILAAHFAFATTTVTAQKNKSPTVGIFASKSEYDQFMGTAKKIAYGPNGNHELQAMIPLLNDIVLNQPIGQTANQYDIESSALGMLADEDVRNDLEMVEDQYEQLKRVNSDARKRMADQVLQLDFSNASNLAQQIKSISQQAQEELNNLLLPHQLKRLQQIQIQNRLRRTSLVDLLTNDPLKTQLDISENQSKTLRLAESEIAAELEKEMARLRAKAHAKLISRLKPVQQKQVKELIGDRFKFTASTTEKIKRANKNKRSTGK